MLEEAFTFCFTDVVTARDFLAQHSTVRNIRNIDISLRVKPLLTELYFPASDGEPQPHIGGGVVRATAKKNPWEDLCRRLCAASLRRLHLRLDSEDLRPWHQRVDEVRFFEQLSRARAARACVLYLPDIPEAPEHQGLPGAYLEGERLEGAPFEVRRGPRPNNWQVHLSRVSYYLP